MEKGAAGEPTAGRSKRVLIKALFCGMVLGNNLNPLKFPLMIVMFLAIVLLLFFAVTLNRLHLTFFNQKKWGPILWVHMPFIGALFALFTFAVMQQKMPEIDLDESIGASCLFGLFFAVTIVIIMSINKDEVIAHFWVKNPDQRPLLMMLFLFILAIEFVAIFSVVSQVIYGIGWFAGIMTIPASRAIWLQPKEVAS